MLHYSIQQEKVRDWLLSFGLEEYWPTFKANAYDKPSALADLKTMKDSDKSKYLGITKRAHLEKFNRAIKVLQYPTRGTKENIS